MRTVLQLLLCLFPWPLRRILLQLCFGYRLHPTSRIGLAWVYPRRLIMERGAGIGHFTVAKGLDGIHLGEAATIGRLNWISGYPSGQPPHFADDEDRRPELLLGEHAAITNRHLVDCTARITIGRYATVAGFRSQLLTHSINLETCRQEAREISIGAYCFVGTACTILGGATLPDHSVLGAHSLLNKVLTTSFRVYAGQPAKEVRELAADLAYFSRTAGFVV